MMSQTTVLQKPAISPKKTPATAMKTPDVSSKPRLTPPKSSHQGQPASQDDGACRKITPPTQPLATTMKKTPAAMKKTPAASTKKAKACRVSQTAPIFKPNCTSSNTSLQLNVTFLSPTLAPRILDEPVVSSRSGMVSLLQPWLQFHVTQLVVRFEPGTLTVVTSNPTTELRP